MSVLGLVPAKRCSAYSHLLKPLSGMWSWKGFDKDGDWVTLSATSQNGKYYFLLRTEDDEFLCTNILIERPFEANYRNIKIIAPEDVNSDPKKEKCTGYEIPDKYNGQNQNLLSFRAVWNRLGRQDKL